MEITVNNGDEFLKVAEIAKEIAANYSREITFNFNGVANSVTAETDLNELYENYKTIINENQ